MKRFRLKADGRIVELRDGKEFPLAARDGRRSAKWACAICAVARN